MVLKLRSITFAKTFCIASHFGNPAHDLIDRIGDAELVLDQAQKILPVEHIEEQGEQVAMAWIVQLAPAIDDGTANCVLIVGPASPKQ